MFPVSDGRLKNKYSSALQHLIGGWDGFVGCRSVID